MDTVYKKYYSQDSTKRVHSKTNYIMPDGRNRADLKVGKEVEIVLKKDQRSGALTTGIIKRILTKSPKHTHGIKVELESGDIGRVKNILED